MTTDHRYHELPARRHPTTARPELYRPDEDTMYVLVDHDPRASFSRSVQPAAMRRARQAIPAGQQWALVSSGSPDGMPHPAAWPEHGTWARSFYCFERQS